MKLIVFLVVFYSVASSVHAKTLILAYESKPNPPYYYGDGPHLESDTPGVTIEVLHRVAERFDIEFKFKRMTWVRVLDAVRANQVDGIFHGSFKPERMKIGVYPMLDSQPDPTRQIMSQSYYLYKRKGAPIEWDGSKFHQITGPIGITRGYSITYDLTAMGIEYEESVSQYVGLKKLQVDRVAGMVDLEGITDPKLQLYQDEFTDVIKVSPPVKSKPYYLIFSHQFYSENTELAEAIWQEIKAIRSSEEYGNISKKYLRD
ncbi:transporter substrate-binding domain-containing protein [Vibrio sp. Of7-15]|uniref:substrate-binding periplasmic protein n=1 Tax=Vibrio sp. Of7-15 TaxID=2724879 RepID=UPI001EF3B7F8|nr:transporter substrate-binding domain-containing protein [Vibrio sp. Of7-15]MCG7497247.1 transporter substrate-binding domain-containing protein [Vibrio sp. Of7-15]